MNGKEIFSLIALVFSILLAVCCSGCATKPAVVIDTGDIERLRYEYQQLRSQYDKLQSDYQRLTNESKFYADYYFNTTETIAKGIGEIGKLGIDSLSEIAKLRSYITIFRTIIDSIITGQQREGREDSQAD
jgi:prefoldin subunit 5